MDPLLQRLMQCTEARSAADPADVERAIMSDDPMLQWFACRAAGQSGDARWGPRLRALAARPLRDNEPDVSLIAVTALGQIAGSAAHEFWAEMAQSASASARRAAADLIGVLRVGEALEDLERLLADPDSEVLSWAALSAAKIGDRAWPMLERAIASTGRPEAFLNYADALLKIDGVRAKPVLAEALQRQSPGHRAGLERAVASLERANDARTLQ